MTTVTQLLDMVRVKGILLKPASGRIWFQAAKGMMTAELRKAIAKHKSELLDWLNGKPGSLWDQALANCTVAALLARVESVISCGWPNDARMCQEWASMRDAIDRRYLAADTDAFTESVKRFELALDSYVSPELAAAAMADCDIHTRQWVQMLGGQLRLYLPAEWAVSS